MLSIITSESPAERAPPRLSGPMKSFPTSRSVPADVNLVDSDSDGWIDRGYAVDLAGKIYRIDFETPGSTAPADWSIYTLADLSGGTTTGRKFFFGPDAVVTKSLPPCCSARATARSRCCRQPPTTSSRSSTATPARARHVLLGRDLLEPRPRWRRVQRRVARMLRRPRSGREGRECGDVDCGH